MRHCTSVSTGDIGDIAHHTVLVRCSYGKIVFAVIIGLIKSLTCAFGLCRLDTLFIAHETLYLMLV